MTIPRYFALLTLSISVLLCRILILGSDYFAVLMKSRPVLNLRDLVPYYAAMAKSISKVGG